MPRVERSVYRRLSTELDTMVSLHHTPALIPELSDARLDVQRRFYELILELSHSGLPYPETLQEQVKQQVTHQTYGVAGLRSLRDTFLELDRALPK